MHFITPPCSLQPEHRYLTLSHCSVNQQQIVSYYWASKSPSLKGDRFIALLYKTHPSGKVRKNKMDFELLRVFALTPDIGF